MRLHPNACHNWILKKRKFLISVKGKLQQKHHYVGTYLIGFTVKIILKRIVRDFFVLKETKTKECRNPIKSFSSISHPFFTDWSRHIRALHWHGVLLRDQCIHDPLHDTTQHILERHLLQRIWRQELHQSWMGHSVTFLCLWTEFVK